MQHRWTCDDASEASGDDGRLEIVKCVVCIYVFAHEYVLVCWGRKMEMCMCMSIDTDLMNFTMKIIWKAHLFQLV